MCCYTRPQETEVRQSSELIQVESTQAGMRGGIRQKAEKKRRGVSTIRSKRRREGESGVVWTWGEHDASQDLRNVATQVRTHKRHGTKNIPRFRQDPTLADQTQDPFLLIWHY